MVCKGEQPNTGQVLKGAKPADLPIIRDVPALDVAGLREALPKYGHWHDAQHVADRIATQRKYLA